MTEKQEKKLVYLPPQKESEKGEKQPKQHWPEEQTEQCLARLAAGCKIEQLSAETGVPKGTLYRWKRQAQGEKQKTEKDEISRETQMAQMAARGALAAVALMEKRIERSARLEDKREMLLLELEKTVQEDRRKLLEKQLKDMEEPLSASSLTTMYKALADKNTAEQCSVPMRLEVVLGRDGEDYAG